MATIGAMKVICGLGNPGERYRLTVPAPVAADPAPEDQIVALNKRQWRKKGIAKITYQVSGRKRRFVIDDYQFDRHATDEVVGSSDGGGTLVYADSAKDHAITRITPRSRGLWAVARPGLHEWHAKLRRLGKEFSPAMLSFLVPEIPGEAMPDKPFALVFTRKRSTV